MKFIDYINESTIKINLSLLQHRIEKVFVKCPKKAGLIDSLNREFKPDDIMFDMSQDRPDIIDGFTFPDTLEIDIYIGVELLELSNDELIKRLIEAMEHEIIHREQLKRSDGKSYTVSLENIDASNLDHYLSDKSEIMSYAAQIVTTLRHEGYKDSQIIDMLRNSTKWESKIVKSRSHLEIYLAVFKKDSYQIKRLKKQIIEYIGQ
jgi:hypothetical protein